LPTLEIIPLEKTHVMAHDYITPSSQWQKKMMS